MAAISWLKTNAASTIGMVGGEKKGEREQRSLLRADPEADGRCGAAPQRRGVGEVELLLMFPFDKKS